MTPIRPRFALIAINLSPTKYIFIVAPCRWSRNPEAFEGVGVGTSRGECVSVFFPASFREVIVRGPEPAREFHGYRGAVVLLFPHRLDES